ncbi:MAG: hypothetical protein DRP56_06765 [Planctomycetota bacterium]|nr:MAG: hypothetical protein DRP56_06765 [Planctomycetota bacterium]
MSEDKAYSRHFPAIEIAQGKYGNVNARRIRCRSAASMQISCLAKVALKGYFLISTKVINFTFYLLAILTCLV